MTLGDVFFFIIGFIVGVSGTALVVYAVTN